MPVLVRNPPLDYRLVDELALNDLSPHVHYSTPNKLPANEAALLGLAVWVCHLAIASTRFVDVASA